MSQVLIIGAGAMGEAIIAGLIKSGTAPSSISVLEKRQERSQEICAQYGVGELSNTQALSGFAAIFLIVKPQDLADTVAEISNEISEESVIISLAAGKKIAGIEAGLQGKKVPVIRVMPNTPALVGEGMAAISGGTHCAEKDLALAEKLLRGTGKVIRVEEDLQNAVTAISGSGPAYFFLIIEAMVAAGIELGLTPEHAHQLSIQTIYGAATMLRDSGKTPTTLRENVTSPNGTTAAALKTLNESRIHEIFSAALLAARDRSRELAQG
jgi:pyrroline-5-carboxylate reductase